MKAIQQALAEKSDADGLIPQNLDFRIQADIIKYFPDRTEYWYLGKKIGEEKDWKWKYEGRPEHDQSRWTPK